MRGLKLLASLVVAEPDVSIWSWATVTATSPLRVKLDGETTALGITPDTIVAGLAVNDRVWVQLVTNANPARKHRRLVVLGRVGCPFPVGYIHVSTSSTNPGTLFGGTWTRIQDRFLLAAGSTYAAGATGGEATHVLTTAEMPSHTHPSIGGFGAGPVSAGRWRTDQNSPSTTWGSDDAAGGGGAHNNMPPYIAVYVWERTA